ncbi:hydantoinase subunit beta [Sulfolobus sp. A20]|uniref:hydantoinase/oxoprolinase N-terminal domain-containing protein n=1 Tax=Sulfolobaceae TaxID=118883 RepID=UPI00084602F7|nr:MULTISPECIES: hydantoinase/oxoprolinase N-terminal domain-containing protein [unclassified Sulfolobus]TRM76748.1 hydantoinase subunit beta [Sulfolobus sp. E5]TRM78064.1 hydantoinase subunit beta [Sulfolobus sp. A20-N-F8]TRM82411.1 hydantoinase subunit beta [Sulfolobus sp. D5]TRM84398.1 hydantoinase subunit beta [Sulfolobus sp. F3]TRM88785.1 hydantoinase subunit beta [Sulfolobus sp. C3]TRN00929.1 hydantoinase subunit beta [Sulfolobus sp. E1]
MAIKIGVDIGSTHTDAVALEGRNLIYATKVETTPDLTEGLLNAITEVINNLGEKKNEIKALMIGTTHGLNAIHQAKRLNRVAVIRIGLPAGEGVPPLTEWPERLRSFVTSVYSVRGGHEYTGEEIVPLDESKIYQIASEINGKVDSVAITSIFSIVNPEHENRVKDILIKEGISVPITLSHQIGGIGLIERENATILNSLILNIFDNLIQILQSLLHKLGLENVELYFAQNDGTIASAQFIRKFPIFTVAGPVSNSIRGAHLLTGITDAIVMDVGGTTTNVGVLYKGYPRESASPVEIAGIRTNFRMPDIFTLALGGGTVIKGEEIGPESVGFMLTKRGLSWGGDTLTATDVSMVVKGIKIEGSNPELIRDRYQIEYLKKIYSKMLESWENAIDMMKTSKEDVIVIGVGGGSIMLPETLKGSSKLVIPKNAQYANAIGCTLTKVGATIERTFSYDQTSRDTAIKSLIEEAKKTAISAGAIDTTIEVREIEELQMPYLPGNAIKVSVKVVGELKI